MASRPPGRSPTTRWSRTTRRPSSSTRCTARAVRIRPSRPRARRTRSRGVARAAHPAALRRPCRGRATTRSTRPAASCSTRRNMPYSACVRCTNCDGFPCLVHAKSDAEVLGVRPALEHPNVTLLTERRRSVRLETEPGRHGGHRGGGRARRRDRALRRRSSWSRVRRGQLRQAAAGVGQRHAPERAGQRLRPGRPQLHVPQQPGGARALARSRTRPVFQKTLGLNDFYFGSDGLRVPDGQHPDGRQVAGADVPRREADRDEARPQLRARATWPSTRSTSGCPPRTCPGRTTG